MVATPTVGACDTKSRLSHLLDQVERGEQFVIARLVPEPAGPDRAAVAAITGLRQDLAARGERVTQDDLRALRDEGRR
jgi:antitoxin (DNA-binding transcriptional repressor) of toxin-antitoxin stability system